MLHNVVAIEGELKRLDLSQSVLCALTSIPAGSLSDIIRGVKKPNFQQERSIYQALESVDRLIKACSPLQLDTSKTLLLRQHIELLDAGRLQISIVVQDEIAQDEPIFSLRLKNGNYFLRVQRPIPSQPEVLSTFNLIGSATFVHAAAKLACAALEGLGHADIKIIENKFVNGDNVIFDVATVGL
jgi:hypothetical protein